MISSVWFLHRATWATKGRKVIWERRYVNSTPPFTLFATCRETQRGLAVAVKHEKRKVNVSHLRGDLWRAADAAEVKCHQLQSRLHSRNQPAT